MITVWLLTLMMHSHLVLPGEPVTFANKSDCLTYAATINEKLQPGDVAVCVEGVAK